jgi:hypothetical protein
MIEEMYSDDAEKRIAYHRGTEEFNNIVANLESSFGAQPHDLWRSASTEQYNSIYDDTVVSTINLERPAYVDGPNFITVGRKFFIRNKWVYDKLYTLTTTSSCNLPYPDGAVPLGLGELLSVYGQTGTSSLASYKCLYFKCDDHNAVETWSGTRLNQGAHSTYYAATFDTNNQNQRLRMKSYCYDAPSVFSDWDVVHGEMIAGRGII